MPEQYYTAPENPVYDAEHIRKILDSDPVQASTIVNPVIEKMIENTAAVKKQTDDKQDALSGTAGQIVGFNAQGDAEAQEISGVGVSSFNGRKGAVLPEKGDYTAAQVGAVPTNRKVNGKPLSTDIELTAENVKARPSTWTPTAADVGAVPTSRKVNGKALSANISLTAADVGARPSTWTPDLSAYAPKASPVFSGSISLGRYASSGIGDNSVAEGRSTIASGECSHAEGAVTTASGTHSHAEGSGLSGTGAFGYSSHAEGMYTIASEQATHAEGLYTTATNKHSHAQGKYNKAMAGGGTSANTVGDAMVIGNGTGNEGSITSNAFRVTFAGAVYGKSSFHSSGADYSEFFEWADGNPDGEDRVGYFVTLDGNKIKKASSGDYLLGIVSGNPCIIGNGDEDWLGRWVHDDFDRFVKEYLVEDLEPLEIPEDIGELERIKLLHAPDVKEQDGKFYRVTSRVVDYETPSWRHKANPDYDNTQQYVERKDRQEWDTVGMLGVLEVWDDGTCEVNGFCKCSEGGKATAADVYIPSQTYRVIGRVSDNVVKVVFR